MNPLEAKDLADLIAGFWPASKETRAAYAISMASFDAEPMKAAITKLKDEYDRLPTFKHLIGAYYAAKREGKQEPEAEDPPCFFCQRDGGWRMEPGGRLWAPRASLPPFTGRQRHTDRDGTDLGPVWDHPPACATHARGLAMSKPRRPVFFTPDPASAAEWQGRYAEEARAWESASVKSPPGPMADVVASARVEIAPAVAVSSQSAVPPVDFSLKGDPNPISDPLVAPAPKSDPGWVYPRGPSPGMTPEDVKKFDDSVPF